MYEIFGFARQFSDNDDAYIERPLHALLEHTLTFTQTMVTRRRSLIDAGLFPRDIFVGEDLHLMARLTMLGPFSVIREPLVRIIRRQEEIHNLTSLRWLHGIETQTKYVQTHAEIRQLPGLTLFEKIIAADHLSRVLRALGNFQMRAGQWIDGRRSFRRAFIVAPSWRSMGKLMLSYAPCWAWEFLDRKGKNIIP
jgi:hypothetical protein